MSINAEPIEHWWHYDAWCQHRKMQIRNFDFNFVTFIVIKLILHLWSKIHPDQSDGLGVEIQDAFESAKEKLPHWTDHITVGRHWANWTLVILQCMMSTSKDGMLERSVLALSFSHDQVNITPLIEDSPWSIRWIRVWDPRCLGECQRKTSSFNGSHHGRSTPSWPNIADIVMHDVNIEETKLELRF